MTTIKFRRDTSANWTSVNPIPAQGEPCYETDTGKLKIGNGSDSYTTLPYVSDSGGSAGDLPIATATTLGGVKIGNNLSITEDGTLSANAGTAGTTDYTQLENKPQINSVELTGNKTLDDLGIQAKGNYQPAGDYAAESHTHTKSEITDFPTIPTVNNAVITIQKNGTKVDSFTANQATAKTINITVPTNAADVSALPSTTKYAKDLSVTIDPDTFVITAILKDQDGTALQTQTIDLPLESVVVSGSYDKTNKKIVLTLQSGSTLDIPVADLIAGLQTEITETNKLNADLIEDGLTNKVVTEAEKTTWSGKQDKISDLTTIRSNAQAGKDASTTISGYGDVVTHDASDFAPASHNHAISEITNLQATLDGKQSKITSTSKLDADLIADGTTNKMVTAAEKETWNNKQNAITDLTTIRTNATNGNNAATTIAGYGDIVTHDSSEFQPAGDYAAEVHTHTKADITDFPAIPSKTSDLINDSGFLTEAPIPTNMVTTDTTQTISGDKTFTRGITTTDIYPAGEITFNSTSTSRYINNVDSITGGYRNQNGYLTFKGDTTLVGDNKLVLNGRNGGITLRADSGKGIDIGSGTNTITLNPDDFAYINGNLKIRRAYSLLLPNSTDTKNTELTSNADYLNIKTSNTRTLANGSAVRIVDANQNAIFKMNYDGSIVNGDLATFINTANIDTTYMKWDTTNKKLKVDTAAVAHLAMPSNTKVNLTLGASGTTYTAPADGYVCVLGYQTGQNGFIRLWCKQSLLSVWGQPTTVANFIISLYIPVSKGDTFVTDYEKFSLGDGYFNFIYAVGTVPTNT